MTGFGRTGKAFGMDHWGISPDLMTVGKGISSGYTPLGGVIVGKIIDETSLTMDQFPHLYTYGFNPLSAATGLAVLRILEREGLIQRAVKIGQYLAKELKTLEGLNIVGDTRGRGLLHGVEFVKNKETKEPFAPEKQVAQKMFKGMASRGVLPYIGTGTVDGTRGDHFTLCPPLIITEEQIDQVIITIEETAKEIK
jgi:adenosylmethionine-8-amino-7-oxononanoate aminotransferase